MNPGECCKFLNETASILLKERVVGTKRFQVECWGDGSVLQHRTLINDHLSIRLWMYTNQVC